LWRQRGCCRPTRPVCTQGRQWHTFEVACKPSASASADPSLAAAVER
jgi:hypothetical protein